MKYYIDKQKFVVYSQIPDSSLYTKNDKDFRIIVDNPKEEKIYLDILEREDDNAWVKIRLYQNKLHSSGETRLEVFEAYMIVKAENHFKIEGLHDTDLFDGRFNIQKDSPNPLHFGNMAWKPGTVLTMPISRDDFVMKENDK